MSDRREVANGINILVLGQFDESGVYLAPTILTAAAIEGGGARGLSSLLILNEIMSRFQVSSGMQEQPMVRDHFDIVAGTGTGAVIACLVGRLGITVKAAIDHYVKLAEVFSEKKLFGKTIYKTTRLQDVLKRIVRDVTGNENTPIMDTSETGDRCRTMIFAMSAHNMNAGKPCVFRSYQGVANQMPDCAIWQVLSATMAHPEMFKPIALGPENLRQLFVDGGLGCNNPTAHVLAEVKALMPDRHVSSVLCIGAGHPDTIRLSGGFHFGGLVPRGVLELTKRIALDAERVADEMDTRFPMPGVYFRFSVDQGMQRVEDDEWEKLDLVSANAQAYMRAARVNARVDQAIDAVKKKSAALEARCIDGAIQTISSPPIVGAYTCPAPTLLFTGRQDRIDKIVACISQGDSRRCVSVLYGLGGAGKTQLALKTVEQTREIWTDIIFVDATSHETAMAALAGFAKEKQIGDTHESAIKWLGNQRERWLMVIDNADDPKVDVQHYFPTGNTGSILITTRIEQYSILAQGQDADCQITTMEEEEAMELLTKTAKIKRAELSGGEHETAMALLENLGYLALAIVQAGAYILCSKCTIPRYLDMFNQHRQETLEKSNKLPVKIGDYRKSVYTTWHMSYMLLSPRAQRMLHLMAFMHHSGIIEDIFQRAASRLHDYVPEIPFTEAEANIQAGLVERLQAYLDSAGVWNPSSFLDTMTELLSYSLVSFDRASGAYSLHVLVHDWASTAISHPTEVALGHTALLLAVSIDYEDSLESLAYKRAVEVHVSRLLERHPDPSANGALRFSEVYYRAGKWKQMEKMEQIVLDGELEAFGEEDERTLTTINNLANSYRQQGRYEEALTLQERLVQVSERLSGAEHSETLRSMQDLAQTYFGLGRYTDAESLQLQTMQVCKRVHGDEHIATLTSMHDLALTYNAQDRYGEAEPLLLRVINAEKRVRGGEHPGTLSSMAELAYTYRRQGRYDEAESMQEHVLEVRKRRLGGEHPSTLFAVNQLASTYWATGRYAEAEALYEQAIETMKRRDGEEHPSTLTAMMNLATVYWKQGRYDKAEVVLKSVVGGQKRVLGTRHPHTLLAMSWLLDTYKSMGESRGSESQLLAQEISHLENSSD